ncbi:MAG: T9SS type A sorting domain-containing protein [Bacteroidota bacterium]
MKKFTLIIFILLIAFNTNAEITFQKTFGGTGNEYGNSVQQTFDGGYIIAGYTDYFGAGGTDAYLIKTDENGDSLWIKTFGGIEDDFGICVQQTSDSGYILVGSTRINVSSTNVYIFKTNANGDSLWSKSFGGIGENGGNSVQQTADGGYIITGYTSYFGAGSYDIYLIKTDANGDSLWTKTFGGISFEYGCSVRQTMDGGYIVVGYSYGFGAGLEDVYLFKTNANGNLLWSKTFGGADNEFGYSVQQTVDSGYIITGITKSFAVAAFDYDVYLIKADSNGDILWTKTFGGISGDYGYSVEQTTDGGYIIVGNSNGFGGVNVYLMKTNANGDLLWTKAIGSTNACGGRSIQQTADGGYIITGTIYNFGASSNDVYLVKTDSMGNSGCTDVSTATIISSTFTQVSNQATIVSSPHTIVGAPTAVLGSGGFENTICTNVGIKEIVIENSLIISPNPSSGNFNISFEKTIIKGIVEISNIFGENVFIENISNLSKKEIFLKNISGGIYFVKVFDGNKSYCKKIIIEQEL